MALTAAERQRRCRLKKQADKEKYEEYLKKARERYHANKKLVKDMNSREKRMTNRKWKIKQKKYREKLKEREQLIEDDTISPSITDASPRKTHFKTKKMRRERTKLYRDNLRLETEMTEWKRKYEACKKKLQRTKSRFDKYEVMCTAIQEKYKTTKSRKDRKIIKEMLTSNFVEKTGLTQEIRVAALGIKCKDKLRKRQKVQKTKDLRKAIQDFYLRDDVSRATAGKKETVTKNKVKKQKRFLLDIMTNLHRSFLKESGMKCCYSYFTMNRPFYVVTPSADARETCLCKLHTNIQYKLLALKKKRAVFTSDLSRFLESVVCSVNQKECMFEACEQCSGKNLIDSNLCPDDEVSWWEWVRKTEEITKDQRKRKISKNLKELQQAKLSDLIVSFKKDLIEFKKHVFNVRIQHKAYRDCIDNLDRNSVAVHIDFSENYNCKCSQEIQSHHFGGSRNQLSLHTAVIYRKPEGAETKEITSFCTISSCLLHNPAAIWAHVDPILKFINENYPQIHTIHWFSDGPCTQYRQKQNFYLMTTRLFDDYGFKNMTWSFFEAGHGKGAADGIGGLIKRTADRMVAHGKDIPDVTHFYTFLKDATKVKLFLITEEDIDRISVTIPTSLLPIPATMRLHHIYSCARGQLKYSEQSCFCKTKDVNGSCFCIAPSTQYEFSPNPVTEDMDLAEDVNIGEAGCVEAGNFDLDEVGIFNSAIQNLNAGRKGLLFKNIYEGSSESDSDSETLAQIQDKENRKRNNCAGTSLDKTIIHPRNIPKGTFLLIKIISERNREYYYVAVTDLDFEDSEVKVTFLRCVDETKRAFRLKVDDVSFVDLDDIIKILDMPSIKMKGKRVLYCFKEPIEEVFEK